MASLVMRRLLRYSQTMERRRHLYDDDIYAWSEEQADALRRLAQTHRDLPNDLDLENVAEEIEDVGISQRTAAESFIRLIFVHLIKLLAAPNSAAAKHWRAEIVTFHNDLQMRLTRSMHQRIDLHRIWDQAVHEAQARLEAEGNEAIPSFTMVRGAPLDIEDLAKDRLDIDAALSAIARSVEPNA